MSKSNRRKSSRKNSRRKTKNSDSFSFLALEPRQLLAGDTALLEFAPEAGLYQVFSNQGQLGKIDLETQSFEVAGMTAGTTVNAAGYRTADNYAYGVITKVNEIARIGADGEIESLGTVEGLPTDRGNYFVGDFANDDLLYLRSGGEKDMLYGVNVDTMKVDNTIKTSAVLNNIYDMAFNNVDQKFYSSQRGPENVLISIDLDGNVETLGENGLQKRTFGAMYADADGKIYGADNRTGEVYRFDTTTGKATEVGRGPSSGSNDGFSNASAVIEIPPDARNDAFEMEGIDIIYGHLFEDHGDGLDIEGNVGPSIVTAINGVALEVGTEVTLDSNASLTVAEDGKFVYKPSIEHVMLTVGESVVEKFKYTVTDTAGRSDTAEVSIVINGTMTPDPVLYRVKGMNSFGGSAFGTLTEVGDINGDGFNDGAIASPSGYGSRGITFLVYGNEKGFTADFNVNDLRTWNGNDGSAGTIFYGIDRNDLSGSSLAGAGDVNGDGFDDLLIGAKDADANGVRNSGQTYVVFGGENLKPEYKLGALLASNGGDGTDGFVVNGVNAHDLTGQVVTAVGDMNADGLDDFAIGAQHADAEGDRKNSGQAYVMYGSKNGFEAEINLSSLSAAKGGDGSKGVVINGVRKHDLFGGSIAGGEDLNGDGISDMLITARNADPNGLVDAGQSYIVYGAKGGFGAEFEVAKLNAGDGTEGSTIDGSRKFENNGSFVDLVADMDGDGVAEILIGKGGKDANLAGVVFSKTGALGDGVQLSSFDRSAVFLDNFDEATDFDSRSWDAHPFSATLHSTNGTQVTIWGDPHVVIVSNGKTERFDIGYGAGTLELVGGAVISWDTFSPDDERFPLGPPLNYFKVETSVSSFDVTVETNNNHNDIGNLTALSEAQLQDFARQIRLLEGDASKPLGT